MTVSELNQYFNEHAGTFPDPFRLRVIRAISWLRTARYRIRGEDHDNDWDMGFIALWIAFNAAYAKKLGKIDTPERDNFRHFLQIVCELDTQKVLYNLVWEKYSSSIRLLLDNKFVFYPFWQYKNAEISEEEWLQYFENSKNSAHRALASQDTVGVLNAVFDRLYTLRNQIMHGGATYHSQANRPQLKDACAFLSATVSQIVAIMMQHPENENWGTVHYPYIKE